MIKNNLRTVYMILTLAILTVGATFAFFTAVIKSDDNIVLESYKFDLVVDIENEFNTNNIIPMYDSDVMVGYNNSCVDSLGNNICQSYKITLTNNGDKDSYKGIINFNIENLNNLKYLILDEDKEIYQQITTITDSSDLSLGNDFEMDNDEEKIFNLVIWLSDTGSVQDSESSSSFSASVTYEGKNGTKITGSILSN